MARILAGALALQPDGKILIAGGTTAGVGGSTDLAVLRVNADRSDDTSFYGTGQRIIDYGGSTESPLTSPIRPDGRIVAVGSGNLNSDIAIQALLANGQGDPGVVNGGVGYVGGDMLVKRLLANGADDASFNGGAPVRVGFNSIATAVALQPDGKIDIGADSGTACAVALQRDGRIVLVGWSASGGQSDLVVVRLDGDPPSAAASRGAAGRPPPSSAPPAAIA